MGKSTGADYWHRKEMPYEDVSCESAIFVVVLYILYYYEIRCLARYIKMEEEAFYFVTSELLQIRTQT